MLRIFIVLLLLALLVAPVWGQDAEGGIPFCTPDEFNEGGQLIVDVIIAQIDLEESLIGASLADIAGGAGAATAQYETWMSEIRPEIPICVELVILSSFMDEALARMSMGLFMKTWEVEQGDIYVERSGEIRMEVLSTMQELIGVEDDGS